MGSGQDINTYKVRGFVEPYLKVLTMRPKDVSFNNFLLLEILSRFCQAANEKELFALDSNCLELLNPIKQEKDEGRPQSFEGG